MRGYLPLRIRRKQNHERLTRVAERESDLFGDGVMDFSPEELREFLEGDLGDVQANPEFRERLRKRLWEMVRLQYGPGTRERDH